jgi:hypothetical protein
VKVNISASCGGRRVIILSWDELLRLKPLSSPHTFQIGKGKVSVLEESFNSLHSSQISVSMSIYAQECQSPSGAELAEV